MPEARVIVDATRMAIGTLTALPVPAPRRIDRQVAAAAMVFAPLAAVLPGLAATGVCWAADAAGASPLVAAGLAIGTVALTTRGLHLDGLADTADGLAASYDRQRALDVMRRGNTGPAGAATLVLVLIVQVAALASALPVFGPLAVAVAVVAGRLALPLGCLHGVPAARAEGLGATVAGAVPPGAAAAALVVVAAAAFAVTGPRGVVAVGLGALASAVLLARGVQRFGGITGDVLGAGVEVATAAALVVLSLHP
jgi:adenosylcobinamide-GDP ribazoletransferase